MADQYTSTDRRLLYKVRFTPGGEEYLVEAGNAQTAHQKGLGHAALDEIRHNGCDVMLADENDITDYYTDGEEE